MTYFKKWALILTFCFALIGVIAGHVISYNLDLIGWLILIFLATIAGTIAAWLANAYRHKEE